MPETLQGDREPCCRNYQIFQIFPHRLVLTGNNMEGGGQQGPLIRVNPGSIFGWGLIFIFGGL
jgi:hypothetical protein